MKARGESNSMSEVSEVDPQKDASPDHEWLEVRKVLEKWRPLLDARSKSHQGSAKIRRWVAWTLGAMAVVFTTLISGATTLGSQAQISGNLGVISILATVVTGLSSFLRFGERAERHLAQANQCHSLMVEIDFLLAVPPPIERRSRDLDSLKERISALGIDD